MSESRTSRRDAGFTLIEMLISVAITGIIALVLAVTMRVAFNSNSSTTQRFNGANDSLTVTNLFSADIAATPPPTTPPAPARNWREVGAGLPSECAGGDQPSSFNVLRLTWSEQAAGVVTYYRTAYRIVNDSSGAGNLVRISCTSTTGDHSGYGAWGSRLVATSLTPIPSTWAAGQVPAVLTYSTLDASDMTLALTVNTKPTPTTVVISAQRSNPGSFLSAEPVANATAELRLLTSVAQASYATPGTVLNFSTIVLNAGTTTLSSIAISDAMPNGGITCSATFLVAGASTTCTFTHVATQADLDGGAVVSTTTGSGTPPTGPPATGSSDPLSVPAVQSPAMTAVKVVQPTTCVPSACYKVAGDIINYTVTVTNTGNVTLSGLSLTDPKSTGAVVCAATTLAPSASTTCTYHYTVVAADLVVGGAVNTAATATANSPVPSTVTATSGSVSVPFQANPSITATKSSSSPSFVAAGQVLDYAIVVTNSGNVSLSSVSVTDPKADSSPTCSPTTIAPGASTTCTAHHTVTAADVTAGNVVNQAMAFGTPASGGGPISASTNTVTVALNTAPSMSITKAVTPSPSTFRVVGDVLNYTLTVKNTGGVLLTAITISDPMDSDGSIPCAATSLVPLATTTCQARHVVVGADLGNPIVNTATANANSAGGPASATSNTVTVNFVPAPGLTVSVTAAPSPFTTVNAVLTYTITITNSGNVPLTAVGITARTLAASTAPSCAASTLAIGAATTCTSTYTTTAADSSGSVTNAVAASGTYNGVVYTASSGSVTVGSAVTCYVQAMSANPASVARNGGNGASSQKLAQDVVVTVTTGGSNCSGLRIRYFPGSPSSVTANMTGSSSSSWSYTIQSNGSNASSWTSTGAKQVDVLPSTGTTPFVTPTGNPFTPFTVTS